jgi:hypothetical protein
LDPAAAERWREYAKEAAKGPAKRAELEKRMPAQRGEGAEPTAADASSPRGSP